MLMQIFVNRNNYGSCWELETELMDNTTMNKRFEVHLEIKLFDSPGQIYSYFAFWWCVEEYTFCVCAIWLL